jgi:hypothetical protein
MSIVLVVIAMVGASLLSLGNLSIQWATIVFGAPLTNVLAVQASLTVALGTSVNYILEAQMTDRVELLIGSVLVFLVAIGLATRAQLLYSDELTRQIPGYAAGIELKENTHNADYSSAESEICFEDE